MYWSLRIRYEDLVLNRLFNKKDTAYFDQFNNDGKIEKVESLDDENMADMFIADRFDTMIILDKTVIETELQERGFSDFAYSN